MFSNTNVTEKLPRLPFCLSCFLLRKCTTVLYSPPVVHTIELLASFWSGFGHLTFTSSEV